MAEVQAVFLTSGRHLIVRVTHCFLIDKLRQLVIPSPLIRWISSYLLNRVQQVGVLGELLISTCSFLRWSVMRPLLFLIYVDGL